MGEVLQGDGLSELNVHSSEFGAQDGGGLEERGDVFFFLFASAYLFLVGFGLDDFFVINGDRDKLDILPGAASPGLHHHPEDAEFGHEELAGAAAGAFKKKLNGGAGSD